MELVYVWRMVRRRWWVILLPVIVASVIAVPDLIQNEQTGTAGYQTNFSYSAAQEASIFETREGDYQDVWLASEFVVNAFTDWVQSSSFRAELATETGNPEMLNGLNIVADNNRSIGIIYMSHPDELILTRLEEAARTVLETRNEDYFPQLGDAPAEVTIINRAGIFPAPQPLTNRFEPLLQLGAAFFAGIVLAGVLEYFDPKLRYVDEVEAQGLSVIARIPKYR